MNGIIQIDIAEIKQTLQEHTNSLSVHGAEIQNLEQENEIINVEISQLQTDTTQTDHKVMENVLKIQENSNSLSSQGILVLIRVLCLARYED